MTRTRSAARSFRSQTSSRQGIRETTGRALRRYARRCPTSSITGQRRPTPTHDQARRSLLPLRSVKVSRPPSDRMEDRAMSGDMTEGGEADSARSHDQSGAIDRRAALKKAAVAAGVAAWTTPVVQVVSSGTAHAQTVTGCSPVVTITLQATGPTCACAPGVSVACCSDNTYVVDSLSLECGPTCAGPAEVAGLIEYPDIGKPEGCLDEVFYFPCVDTRATFRARIPIRCPDGEIYLFDATVTAVCLDCDLELDVPPAIEPEDLVFSDETRRRRPKRRLRPRARRPPPRRPKRRRRPRVRGRPPRRPSPRTEALPAP